MDNRQQQLLNMHTFSTVAKVMSFTLAAEELFISQGAVSQRIKNLEQQLGFPLFIRMTRRLELTPEGERLLITLNRCLIEIFSEIEDIKSQELSGELYIGAAPTFAQNWLLPRLANFQKLYPNLSVKLRVKASRLDFQHEPVDIAIYYGDDDYPEFFSQRLFTEKLTPVCNPDYYQILLQRAYCTPTTNSVTDTQPTDNKTATNDPLINNPVPNSPKLNNPEINSALFQQATFIHCSESLEASAADKEWQQWLRQQRQFELENIDVMGKTYIFNHADIAINAAKQAMGFAMARKALVAKSLKEGSLVAPFQAVEANKGYDIICLNGQQTRPKIASFIAWIKQQVQLDNHTC